MLIAQNSISIYLPTLLSYPASLRVSIYYWPYSVLGVMVPAKNKTALTNDLIGLIVKWLEKDKVKEQTLSAENK